MRMALDEMTIIKGTLATMSGVFAWLFKRQVDRIDELEDSLAKAAVIRAETHKDVKHLADGVDALRIEFKAHIAHEEHSGRELYNAVNIMNDKMGDLSKTVAVLNDRMARGDKV